MASNKEGTLFQKMWPFLQKIEAKWKDFAYHLGIDPWKIDNIKANCFAGANNKDSCREMLSHWLVVTPKDKRKWSTIKKAASNLGHEVLVKSLAGVNDEKEPTMKEFLDLVISKITDNWFEFGIELEIHIDKLNTIKKDHSGGGNSECMKTVVYHWLKSQSNSNACWEHVISALNDIKEIRLVEEVEKYIAQLKEQTKEEPLSVPPQQNGSGTNLDITQHAQNQLMTLPTDPHRSNHSLQLVNESIPSSRQKQNVEDVLRSFNQRLVPVLPMEDAIFLSSLDTAGLFPGDSKATVQSIDTSAAKAGYFIDRVILPDVASNRTNLNKLLAVMKKFNNSTVKNLAAEIQKALQ